MVYYVHECMYWHQSLSVSIPFLSPNVGDWLIWQIQDNHWLRVMAGIQNVPKQNFQDSNTILRQSNWEGPVLRVLYGPLSLI